MKAEFVSVWDTDVRIGTTCNYNPKTKKVTNVKFVDVQGVDILEEEYVELPDGTQIRDFFDIDGTEYKNGHRVDEE